MDPLLIAEQLRAPQPAKPSNTQMIVDTLRSMAGAATDKEFWKDIGKGVFNQELPKPANTYAEMQQMWRDDPSRRLNQVMGVAGFAPLAATVFHGSPFRFDKFDASKIGTGEGAQAYGHGLYLADNPEVARAYSAVKNPPPVTHQQIDDVLAARDKALMSGKSSDSDALKKARESLTPRNLYKVDLPDSAISKMLDWDKPVSELSKEQLAALKRAGAKIADYWPNTQKVGDVIPRTDSAARELAKAGIPGIRYLDQGSRATGKGTYNYVVFPGGEDMLKILGRE